MSGVRIPLRPPFDTSPLFCYSECIMADSNTKRTFADLIKSIYLYLFTGIGLILLIVGIFQLSGYAVNKIAFDKYQLGYEENRCDFGMMPEPVKTEGAREETPGERNERQQKCEQQLEEFRRFREVTDLSRAITFIIVGSAVFAFHLRRTTLLTRS